MAIPAVSNSKKQPQRARTTSHNDEISPRKIVTDTLVHDWSKLSQLEPKTLTKQHRHSNKQLNQDRLQEEK